MFRKAIAQIAGHGLVLFVRMVTAPRAIWAGIEPIPRQRVYFANHTSNADFPLIWSVLPTFLRSKTRPVAASDYWLKNRLRAFFGRDVLNAVLINRDSENRDPEEDPVARMIAAIDGGASLIIFPEGKRNLTEDPLLPFKTGLYHLARARPGVDLVPTWIDNLNSVLPKGEVVPVPLICTVTFGPPIHIAPGEDREIFLDRAHRALVALHKAGEA
ncbi:lysophospholipid acyltransferase family protein [Sinisalibacter lacisalsi]|uniref:1-acyl-sn-glycerol-3-phosphate acyltransferase n=1 Tax=Sinisalibacter lacisalsi TaxID=1526570 RepID=A0ABQ1QMZ6_9RHOB|nr:lysophospholipid acyltransferase family protein [Sinisalibacter lacisalsi]GGD37444.1 1-acyl-sn-glycerol-3-phosphate acyltransferase [Sinisalibacter lacisalsi]